MKDTKDGMIMKKLISFICITILMLSLSVIVFAGSVPEDLLHHDGAHIFFGEIISYTENGDVAVSPVKKIKGDINTGTKQNYSNANAVGDINVKPGNVYLFTYFDENNPTDIFEVTSYDTKTLKLKNVEGDMWERFEKYLNDGKYEKAEQERIDKLNAALTEEGAEISLTALFEIDRDKCDKIEFALFNRQQNYEIDKEKFFTIADKIILKDVKNTLASSDDSFVINACEGEKTYSVYMWDNCKVANSRTEMFSAPQGDYIIKAADYEKLIELFPEEAQPNLPKLKSTYANFAYWIIDNPTTAYTIGALILIIFVGVIGFVIGYKIRKKKARR